MTSQADRPQQQNRVADPLGPVHSIRRPDEALLEERRHEKWIRNLVQDTHEGGGITRLISDGNGFIGERATSFEGATKSELSAQTGQ
jgi:hypothetical protein